MLQRIKKKQAGPMYQVLKRRSWVSGTGLLCISLEIRSWQRPFCPKEKKKIRTLSGSSPVLSFLSLCTVLFHAGIERRGVFCMLPFFVPLSLQRFPSSTIAQGLLLPPLHHVILVRESIVGCKISPMSSNALYFLHLKHFTFDLSNFPLLLGSLCIHIGFICW